MNFRIRITTKFKIVTMTILMGYLCLNLSGLIITSPATSQDQKLKIMTTISIPYDIVKNIAGDAADVSVIVTGDTDVHSYAGPSTQTIQAIANSSILIAMGSTDVEPWLPNVLAGLGSGAPPVLDLINSSMYKFDPLINEDNPHVWMDPYNVKEMANTVTTELIKLDPTNRPIYLANNQTYQGKLDSLIQRVEANRTIFQNTKVVVNHPAYMYLFNLLGINTVGTIQVHDQPTEPSQEHINQIISTMKEQNISIIVTNPQASNAPVITVARDTNAKIATLTPLLYTLDQNGAIITNYIQMIDYDLWALKNPVDPPLVANYNIYLIILGGIVLVAVAYLLIKRRV